VIDVDLPEGSAASALTRGFAACLASVTERSVHELPLPAGDLSQALGAWRTWLAEHGSGLVPIAEPQTFQWPGWWIAVVRTDPINAPSTDPSEVAALAFGTPPGIVLSPQDPTMLGRATADLPITAAYAVASLDPVPRPAPAAFDLHGTVEALAIARAAEADMQLLDTAQARAGHGSTATATPPAPAPSAPPPTTGLATTSPSSPPRSSTSSPLPATPSTSPPPAATSSPAAST